MAVSLAGTCGPAPVCLLAGGTAADARPCSVVMAEQQQQQQQQPAGSLSPAPPRENQLRALAGMLPLHPKCAPTRQGCFAAGQQFTGWANCDSTASRVLAQKRTRACAWRRRGARRRRRQGAQHTRTLCAPHCVICCHCPSAASFQSVTVLFASDTDRMLPLTDQLTRHTGAPKSCSTCRSQPPAFREGGRWGTGGWQ